MYGGLVDKLILTRVFTREQLLEDVDYLFNRLQELHPDLASRLSAADIDALRKTLVVQIDRPMSRREFYRVVGAATEKFRDGHAGVFSPSPEFDQFVADGGLLFPMTVLATREGLFVERDHSASGALPPGARLLSINNVSASDMLALMTRYTRGESLELRQQIAANSFSGLLWHLYDFDRDFAVSYELDGMVRNASVEAIADQEFKARIADGDRAGGANVSYSSLGDGVGYLNVSCFGGDEPDFESALKRAVETARAEKIHAIVVDLRKNPGGSTDNVATLLARLSSKQCALVSRVKEKLNDQNSAGAFRGKLGNIVDLEIDTTVFPLCESQRFPGNVYLLIGPYTYSAAIVMATAVQDCGIGTLVGEETAGFANQTGQMNFFNLPNSRLLSFSPTRLMLRPSGAEGLRGVVPDYVVAQSGEQLRIGKDAALDLALQLASVGHAGRHKAGCTTQFLAAHSVSRVPR